MYFWRIEKLKMDMATRPLSAGEVLPYAVIFSVLLTPIGYIPNAITNIWDVLGLVWSIALAVFGTIYIYRQNGGASGQHFLQRYLVIGWVVAIRWLVVLILPIGGLVILDMEVLGNVTGETTWYIFLFFALLEAVLYWRTGYHVRDLAQRTKVA
jgi:hypothetical protein